METDTIDMIEEEEEMLARPSSWLGALAQLPGFPEEGRLQMPQAEMGAARAVTSALEDELEEELAAAVEEDGAI